MCGIVGVYLKTKKFEKDLGKILSGMLNNMESRGPDSAGFAIYNNQNEQNYKYSLCINKLNFDDFKNIILFLGKSGKSSIEQCLKNWNLEFIEKKSVTEKDSIIIKINKVSKKK